MNTYSDEGIVKEKKKSTVVPFELDSSRSLPREYIQTLYKTGDRSASQIQIFLKQILRTDVRIQWIGVEPMPFIEFINKLDPLSVILILRLYPLECFALLSLSIPSLSSVIDRLLGGGGVASPLTLEFTSLEQEIIDRVVTDMLNEIWKCFQNIVNIKHRIERLELHPQLAHIMRDREDTIVLSYRVAGKIKEGSIHLCLPTRDLTPYLESVTQKEQVLKKRAQNPAVTGHIMKCKLTLSAVLGDTNLMFRELEELKEGDILCLSRAATQPSLIRIGKSVKFEGNVGICGKQWAFLVTRVVEDDKNGKAGADGQS